MGVVLARKLTAIWRIWRWTNEERELGVGTTAERGSSAGAKRSISRVANQYINEESIRGRHVYMSVLLYLPSVAVEQRSREVRELRKRRLREL